MARRTIGDRIAPAASPPGGELKGDWVVVCAWEGRFWLQVERSEGL